jgi:multiple sugar transport system substrate-binding protein
MAARITRRNVLKWGMVGIGGVALAACTPKAPTAAPTQAPAAKATAVPATPAPKPAVQLQLINQNPFGEKSWEEIYKEFESTHPGITVTRGLLPFADIEPKILTSLAGGLPIDVIYVHPLFNNTFALKGALLPLDDYLPQLGVPVDDWYPVYKFGEWRGKMWSLPHQNNSTILVYNHEMFAKAGLKEPAELQKEGKWTLEVYNEYMQKLTQGQGPQKQFGANWAWGGSLRTMQIVWIWGHGGDAWNADETKTLLNQPEALRAWEQMASYQWNGWAPAPGELQGVSGVGIYQRCALGTTARFVIKQAADSGTVPPVRLANVPTFPNGKSYVRDAATSFGIFGKSTHRQEAWEFLRWMTVEGVVMLMKQGWAVPLRKSQINHPAFLQGINAAYESADVLRIANENIRLLSHVPRMSEIDKMVQAAFESAMLKQKSIKQAMDEIVRDIEEILEETRKTPLPQSW